MRDLITKVQSHLRSSPLEPILLGLSGGPDSMALFHLLLAVREYPREKIVAVHIDHGWRTSSKDEASWLREYVESKGCQFLLFNLSPDDLEGNLENGARNQRRQAFLDAAKNVQTQQLYLAHTLDDQAEVVLKRLFEGGAFHKIKGMQEYSERDGLQVHRPLLSAPKLQLVQFLQKRNISYVDDPTNRDTKFLRARMRQGLMPYLSGLFGKDIKSPLQQLAQEATLHTSYFDALIDKSYSVTTSGATITIALTQETHPYLALQLLYRLDALYALGLSREQLLSIALHVAEYPCCMPKRYLTKKCRVEVSNCQILIEQSA